MNRSSLKLAAATLLIGTFAGQAQADTVWHYPYKGQPYATRDDSARTSASRAPRERSYHTGHQQSNPSLGGRAGSTRTPRSAGSKVEPQR